MADQNVNNSFEQVMSSMPFSGLGMDKNTRAVKTEKFTVEGHLLKWKDTAIQISNISMVTIGNSRPPRLPAWAIPASSIGLILLLFGGSKYGNGLTTVQEIGLLCAVIGWAAIGFWIYITNEINKHKHLHFLLNNGITYSIEFTDFAFLQKVMCVFEDIFRNGVSGGTYYYFDLKNSDISQSQIAGKIQN